MEMSDPEEVDRECPPQAQDSALPLSEGEEAGKIILEEEEKVGRVGVV